MLSRLRLERGDSYSSSLIIRDSAPPSLKRNHVMPRETSKTATALMRLAISEVEAWDKLQRAFSENLRLSLFKDLELQLCLLTLELPSPRERNITLSINTSIRRIRTRATIIRTSTKIVTISTTVTCVAVASSRFRAF